MSSARPTLQNKIDFLEECILPSFDKWNCGDSREERTKFISSLREEFGLSEALLSSLLRTFIGLSRVEAINRLTELRCERAGKKLEEDNTLTVPVNVKCKTLKTSSYATECSIADNLDPVVLSVSAHRGLLFAQIDIYSSESAPEWCTRAGRAIASTARYTACSKVGIGWERRDIEDVTAHICSIISFFSPKALEDGFPAVLWLHQESEIDICGVRYQSKPDQDGYEPRVFFKFMNPANGGDKASQLFSHINNSSEKHDVRHSLVALGVVVTLTEESGTYSLRGYYKTLHLIKTEWVAKIAVVKMASGVWDANGIAKLLDTLYKFLAREPCEFDFQLIDLNERHFLDDSTYVYKVFDSRGRLSCRQAEPNVAWIEGCTTVVTAEDNKLVVIRYPFIHGCHEPASSTEVSSLIEDLIRVHHGNYVHGDVRASNIIFSSEGSKLIDFDLAGVDGEAMYPVSYNHIIGDGKRHPEAKCGSVMYKKHDWYALASIMEMYYPVESDKSDLWMNVVNLVRIGEWGQAIDALRVDGFSLAGKT